MHPCRCKWSGSKSPYKSGIADETRTGSDDRWYPKPLLDSCGKVPLKGLSQKHLGTCYSWPGAKAAGQLTNFVLQVESANRDPYEARRAVDMATGSSALGDAAQATAAVADAAALAGPIQFFCDLCQVQPLHCPSCT